MPPQLRAFWLFIVVGGLVVAFFLWVALSTRHMHDVDARTAYRLRRRFFFVLLAVLVLSLVMTVPHMPYPVADQRPDRVVFVAGKQFAFGISNEAITNDEEWEAATYAPPVEVPIGALIEFRVSSLDVNHGFGVYSPSGALVAQVQAMPGYVNRLRVRFNEPGTYNVLCLELCGRDHHVMSGVFKVVTEQHAVIPVSLGRRTD